jgi:hypothetical protein
MIKGNSKGGDKVVPVYAMKTILGVKVQLCSFLTSALWRMSVFKRIPHPFYPPWEQPQYPMNRRISNYEHIYFIFNTLYNTLLYKWPCFTIHIFWFQHDSRTPSSLHKSKKITSHSNLTVTNHRKLLSLISQLQFCIVLQDKSIMEHN